MNIPVISSDKTCDIARRANERFLITLNAFFGGELILKERWLILKSKKKMNLSLFHPLFQCDMKKKIERVRRAREQQGGSFHVHLRGSTKI